MSILSKEQQKSHRIKGYLYAVLASALYASVSVLGKMVYNDGTEPVALIFYQYLLTCTALVIGIIFIKKDLLRVTKKQVFELGVQGIFGAFATNILFFFALTYMNAGIASMLLFTNPLFVTLFFALTGIKKLRAVNYIALAMALGGAMLVLNVFSVRLDSMPLVGICLGLTSAVTFAFYNVYADLKMTAMSPYTVILYSNLFGLVASLVTILGVKGGIPEIGTQSWIYIAMIAVLSGILPVIFFYRSVAIIGSERTSIVSMLELPFTLMIAFLLLREKLNFFQIFGVLLVLGATVFLHYGDSSEPAIVEKQAMNEVE